DIGLSIRVVPGVGAGVCFLDVGTGCSKDAGPNRLSTAAKPRPWPARCRRSAGRGPAAIRPAAKWGRHGLEHGRIDPLAGLATAASCAIGLGQAPFPLQEMRSAPNPWLAFCANL